MVRHPPNNNQRTAALFLQLGHHDALVSRLHRIYRSRWEAIGQALKTHMPDSSRIPSFGGTSFWVWGPDTLDSEELARVAAKKSILIEPGRVHFGRRDRPRNFFRLGFSSIPEERIAPGIELLAECVDACP